MSLIDVCFNATHASFKKDFNKLLERAKNSGVTQMIVPGSSLSDSHDAIQLSDVHKTIFKVCVGVHPHLAREWDEQSEAVLHTLAQHKHVVAIGETGLDYNRNYSTPDQQNISFQHHISVAIQTQLPLFLHQRDAHEDFIQHLKKHRAKLSKILVHCFTGTQKELNDYLELDCYIGITGWICDPKRGAHLYELVREIPQNRLLLETDAPYLLPKDMEPKPQDKRRNEPAFLPHIAMAVARHLKMSAEELATITSANAKDLFGL
ncbi:MAG: TatD family hydrolase [Candidatus Oxydemutatoraceae bacterium WSBS_2016_MAG_OTU14]